MLHSVKISPYKIYSEHHTATGYYVKYSHDEQDYFSEVCLHTSLGDPSLDYLQTNRALLTKHCMDHLESNQHLIEKLFNTDYAEIKKHHLLYFKDYCDHGVEQAFYKIKGIETEQDLKTVLMKARRLNHKIRLDFQNKFSREEFLDLVKSQKTELLKCIDYIEDPYELNEKLWKQDSKDFNLCFAVDKNSAPNSSYLKIYKPLHHRYTPSDGNYILSSLMGGYLSDALTMIFHHESPSKFNFHGVGYSSEFEDFEAFDGDDVHFVWNKKNKNLLVSQLNEREWYDL